MGGRPSQVNRGSIRVSYTEDLREGYRGYSVANISWSRPEGNIASVIYRRQSVVYIIGNNLIDVVALKLM